MGWTEQYTVRSGDSALYPVYVLLILEDKTSLGADFTPGDASIDGVSNDSLVIREDGDSYVMLYDADGFVIHKCYGYDSATNDWSVREEGALGTVTRLFEREKSAIGKLWLGFSTKQITTGSDSFLQTGMGFPDGSRQEIDYPEGYTRSNPVIVPVQDIQGRITRELYGRTLVGKTAMLLGGYDGMDFSQYSMLHCGPITSFTIRSGVVYEIEIDTVAVKLKRTLFGDIDSFSTTLSGNINSTATSLSLTDPTQRYAKAFTMLGANPRYPLDTAYTYRASFYMKIDNEYIRQDGSTHPISISRGRLGSTAASHSAGATVDYLFVVEANPINILIGLLITRDPGFTQLLYPKPGESLSFQYYDFNSNVDPDKGALGLHIDIADIDLASFERIRDDYFPRYVGRVSFSGKENMETWLRDSILKPLGLNLFVSNTGKLTLSFMNPPLDVSNTALDSTNLVDVAPDIEFTNEEILNEVEVSYDYDYISTNDSSTTLTVVDATSQSLYDRAGNISLEARFIRSDLRGATIAERLAKKKMRPLKAPNPMITVEALLSLASVNIGSVLRLTVDGLPDAARGQIGFDRLCYVTGRNIDWEKGTLQFDLIDTAYNEGQRYCLIAPSGTVDYSSATDAVRLVYGFISDPVTERMPDNTDSYRIM